MAARAWVVASAIGSVRQPGSHSAIEGRGKSFLPPASVEAARFLSPLPASSPRRLQPGERGGRGDAVLTRLPERPRRRVLAKAFDTGTPGNDLRRRAMLRRHHDGWRCLTDSITAAVTPRLAVARRSRSWLYPPEVRQKVESAAGGGWILTASTSMDYAFEGEELTGPVTVNLHEDSCGGTAPGSRRYRRRPSLRRRAL
jgi:hypothetical protein